MISAAGATYRIGPKATGRETLYVGAAHLAACLGLARPGQSFIYARGPALDPAEPSAALVRRWIDEGRAIAVKPREDETGVLLHFVKVLPAPAEVAAAGQFAPESEEMRLLSVLRGLALDGAALPSNEALAEMAGLHDRKAAEYRTHKLAEAGLIAVRRIGTLPGGGAAREIEIVGKGWITRSRPKLEANQ